MERAQQDLSYSHAHPERLLYAKRVAAMVPRQRKTEARLSVVTKLRVHAQSAGGMERAPRMQRQQKKHWPMLLAAIPEKHLPQQYCWSLLLGTLSRLELQGQHPRMRPHWATGCWPCPHPRPPHCALPPGSRPRLQRSPGVPEAPAWCRWSCCWPPAQAPATGPSLAWRMQGVEPG